MTTINIRDLANNMPAILAALAQGEEFLLTDAGLPVAHIAPVEPKQADSPSLTGEAWWRELNEWNREAEERAHRYPPGFEVDASREAIYGERENSRP